MKVQIVVLALFLACHLVKSKRVLKYTAIEVNYAVNYEVNYEVNNEELNGLGIERPPCILCPKPKQKCTKEQLQKKCVTRFKRCMCPVRRHK